ncbi:CDP-6-deoxy-delta-3,4-glucoseen reductase [Salmonella enterica subsp. enterica]|uniref:CDP-6-deoxy-delta-3,4-glucoseen reductase n=1 Tax=Salmonella enterica I TaxID=59201 RepID=A0A3S4K9J1_SALET|nr:CDP-6-deoxy-delta-3,4-glucoseen reductase [Salmonella enterica subsp. enterica]
MNQSSMLRYRLVSILNIAAKAGDCGICESDLLAGEVVDSKGNIFGQGDKILTCCCKPKTALELNAHFFPELAGQTKKKLSHAR